jgi:hypothetical protein
MSQQLLHGPDVVALLQRWVANEWRKVWHVAGLLIPAARTASFTAR